MKKEEWKDIKGYEHYMVSNMGNVYSKIKGIILKPGDNGRGYMFVNLHKNKTAKSFYIHRLVGDAFIKQVDGKPQINHKDCNKKNNHVENLEWVDNRENTDHAVNNNRFYTSEYQKKQTSKANSGVKSHLSKLNDELVREIRLLKENGLTCVDIARRFAVHRETIGCILRGRTWKHVI